MTTSNNQFKRKLFLLGKISILSGLSLTTIGNAQEVPQIAGPPEIRVADENNVNLISGQRTETLSTVNIGSSPHALTHVIGTHVDYFYGYFDNFTGYVKNDRIKVPFSSPQVRYEATKTVVVGHSSTSFFINDDGTYSSIRDPKSTLTSTSEGYEMIDGEGKKFIFEGESLVQIIHPNGFTVDINLKSSSYKGLRLRKQSVTTNNGLMLKYNYSRSNAPYNDEQLFSWSYANKIDAVNLTEESCAASSDSCNFENEWPYAQFSWSGTMPTALFNGPLSFNVEDAMGKITTYNHEPKSLRYSQSSPYTEPRLVSIQYSHDSSRSAQFSYGHIGSCVSDSQCYPSRTNVVKRSTNQNMWWIYTYDGQASYGNSHFVSSSSSPKGRLHVSVNTEYGVPYEIRNYDKTFISLEQNYTNFVQEVKHLGTGRSVTFDYDSRGNITKRTEIAESGSGLADIVYEAEYPSSCSNRKTCNKPVWVTDAKGNRTDFEYHPQSGQLAKITWPANREGIRPQTRYTYSAKYAYYSNSNGTLERADTPIWLLVKESACKSGNVTSSGCAISGDEIITSYDYGPQNQPNNLWLRGITIQSNNVTKRTCYEYDSYGNQISTIEPNANRATCY